PLPTGTVTFLLTDIEGSTRMWEEQPEAMRAALVLHDEVAAATISEFAGSLIKSRGEGDSLFAVFALATDAIACARALQAAIMRGAGESSTLLRVRMALHTGEPLFRDGDYFGSVVNRCARLRAIGHGRQVLLSASTAQL